MSMLVQHHDYTFDDYLRVEADSEIKHEFLDGSIWAMAGGTLVHSAIAANVTIGLGNGLRDKPCRVLTSDMRIRVKATGLATYPDASIVCGKAELDEQDSRNHTLTNLVVIVEVLRPSTERYDRGEKTEHYKKIPTLREIVLIAADQRRVEIWRRVGVDWVLGVVRDSGSFRLDSVDCELTLEDIYRDLS